MNSRVILEAASRKFPLSNMGKDFKGTHSLTLGPEGQLALTVWANQTAHTFYLDATEENIPNDKVDDLMGQIATMIVAIHSA